MLNEIPERYMSQFEPSLKVGLLATVNNEGLPHVTLISSIQANTPKEIIWGEFIEGMSKKNVEINHKTGFLIMNLDKKFWRGKAIWTHKRKEGPEYEMFNKKPLYRYNSYCGISVVHYMDLVEISEESSLDIGAIALGAALTKIAKGGAKKNNRANILKPWAEGIFNKIGNLKFISYIGDDGYPNIIPIIQAQAADSTRIVFSASLYKEELLRISEGTDVAVFCMTLDMEDVLVVGKFEGFRRCRGINIGVMDIQKVYNPMPPKHGYVYPEEVLKPV